MKLPSSMAANKQASSGPSGFSRIRFAGALAISAVYFADIFLKASHKCYWFDELFTVYLCRLPSFADLWRAVLHGADFNPPLFYLLIRCSQRLFGDGLIATRLPATIGVWLFAICLFFFVEKRVGVTGGLIAGLFPFFTLAQYYAYEARAHGIVLGWCGLALLCWQREAGERLKYWWLAGFSLSLAGALLTHIYAVYLLVPFAVAELDSLCRRDRVNWAVLAAMLCATAPIILFIYQPLLHIYRATIPHEFFVPNSEVLQSFLIAVYGPAISVLLLNVLIAGLAFAGRPSTEGPKFSRRELLVAATFTFIPILGFLGARMSHGPFLNRYFLTSAAGVAIFLAQTMCMQRSGRRGARVLAACMLFLLVADLGITTWQIVVSHRLSLREPSTNLVISTTPSDPMQRFQSVATNRSGEDVVVLPAFDYFYFVKYAPPAVLPRLYYAPAGTGDVGLGLFSKLAQWGHVEFHVVSLDDFLSTHQSFLVYAGSDGGDPEALKAIAAQGCRFVSAKEDAGGILYEYAK